MKEWENYSGRLLWAMRRAGKTNQSELARAIGVKPQSIQYLCNPLSGAQGSLHTPAVSEPSFFYSSMPAEFTRQSMAPCL